MKTKSMSRLLVWLLTLALVVGQMSVMVFAEDNEEPGEDDTQVENADDEQEGGLEIIRVPDPNQQSTPPAPQNDGSREGYSPIVPNAWVNDGTITGAYHSSVGTSEQLFVEDYTGGAYGTAVDKFHVYPVESIGKRMVLTGPTWGAVDASTVDTSILSVSGTATAIDIEIVGTIAGTYESFEVDIGGTAHEIWVVPSAHWKITQSGGNGTVEIDDGDAGYHTDQYVPTDEGISRMDIDVDVTITPDTGYKLVSAELTVNGGTPRDLTADFAATGSVTASLESYLYELHVVFAPENATTDPFIASSAGRALDVEFETPHWHIYPTVDDDATIVLSVPGGTITGATRVSQTAADIPTLDFSDPQRLVVTVNPATYSSNSSTSGGTHGEDITITYLPAGSVTPETITVVLYPSVRFTTDVSAAGAAVTLYEEEDSTATTQASLGTLRRPAGDDISNGGTTFNELEGYHKIFAITPKAYFEFDTITVNGPGGALTAGTDYFEWEDNGVVYIRLFQSRLQSATYSVDITYIDNTPGRTGSTRSGSSGGGSSGSTTRSTLSISPTNPTWTRGSGGLTFTVPNAGPIAVLSVAVDGDVLTSSSYSLAEGLNVTLSAAYLEGLANGTHRLTITLWSGSVATEFTVAGAAAAGGTAGGTTGGGVNDNPETGATPIGLAMLLMAGGLVGAVNALPKKRK